MAAHRTCYLEVQAFLILERVARSKEFLLSVLLQAGGQFLGKGSLGTIAEGHQISVSLGWDQPRRRFVAGAATSHQFQRPFRGFCIDIDQPYEHSQWRRAANLSARYMHICIGRVCTGHIDGFR